MTVKRDARGDSAATLHDAAEIAGRAAAGDLPPPALGPALRSGAVYVATSAFGRGIVFLLLPVYTRVLDPAAYGRLSVLLAIAALAVIVLSCGMDTAFFRSYFALRDDPEQQRRFVTTVWIFLLAVPPAGAALLALAAAPIFAGSEVVPAGELALALAGAAIFVSATVVPLSLLRAEERLRDFVVLTTVTGVATAGFTLGAVVAVDGGVMGWLVAVVAANAVTLAVAVRLIPLRLDSGVDRRLLHGALALGLPLTPHVLSHWGLGISNRLVLTGIVSTSQVGVYALAANIALPVAIVMQSMGNAFMPTYARAATEGAALAALRRVIIVQYLMVLAVATLGALVGPIAVRFLAAPEYTAAAGLVPWIAAGYGLLGLYFLPMNAVVLTEGRAGKVWIATLSAAAANVACLLALVPVFGLVGAAMAVTVGYLVLLVGVGIYSHGPGNPVRYEWGRLARGALVFAAVYVAAVATSGDRAVVDLCIRLGWLALVPALLVVAGVVDRGHLAATARRLSRRRRLAASV